ncbi:MAG: class I SAM-dependent methyltransferase [Candidatus Altiarchaeota archaeon]
MTQATWDRLSEDWSKTVQEPGENVVEFAGSFKQKRKGIVLDVGCGTGRHLVFLQKSGFSCVGFDISLTALRKSKEWLTKEGLPPLLVQADMQFFPFKDRAYDAEIAVKVIQHGVWVQVEKALAEISRSIKRGGFILLISPSNEDKIRETGKEIEPNTFIGIDRPDGEIPHHFLTEDEIKEAFNEFTFHKFDHQIGESRFDPGKPNSDWIVVGEKV